ncbi:hypothetical protein [Mesobacillus stamsii]|uniref:Uncharacterized protein n=1 Tax=Mesobacillus stamsii TaxID=225347 RepID=A0ABU0FRN0_9BACI|nr:hypothetical protein [Mesobacillus stamsii]MDQ0412564.1 hypothetical protein [Mesobacillus stamsii]
MTSLGGPKRLEGLGAAAGQYKSEGDLVSPDKRCPPRTPRPVAGGSSTSCASEVRPVKSLFDFIGRTEIEMYSQLPRNTETGDSDKEALFASAGGVEVSEFLGTLDKRLEG